MTFHDDDNPALTLQRQKLLGFSRALLHLLSCQLVGKESLQRYYADMIAGRRPGEQGSALFGQSQDTIDQIRSRFLRELIEAVHQMAMVLDGEEWRKDSLLRLAAAMESARRRADNEPSNPLIPGGFRRFKSIDEAVTAFVSIMKAQGIGDERFLIPRGPVFTKRMN